MYSMCVCLFSAVSPYKFPLLLYYRLTDTDCRKPSTLRLCQCGETTVPSQHSSGSVSEPVH